MGDSAENPFLLDEEEDMENYTPTTLVSERPTRTPAFLRFVHLEQERKILLIMLIQICFNKYYRVCL